MDHHWIHAAPDRLMPAPRHRDDVLALPPARAEVWRLCVDMRLDRTGLPMPASDAWGAASASNADEAPPAPSSCAGRPIFPARSARVTAWQRSAVPVFRTADGELARHGGRSDAALRCGTAEGPLVVVTTEKAMPRRRS